MGAGKRLSNRIKNKDNKRSKTDMADLFNNVSYDLILEFMKGVEVGEIKISDTTDLMRLYQIWGQVNEIDTEGEGTGVLPAISKRETEGSSIPTKELDTPEGEKDTIDTDELMNMTSEEVDKMMADRLKSKNELNEEESTG